MAERLDTAEVFASLDSLAYAQGRPECRATLKARFSDFRVDEELGFEPSGEGEHLFVKLRKQDLSTTDTARHLARLTGANMRDIGYSGMKDRRGECSQWFSIRLDRGADADLDQLGDERLQLLRRERNHRKLRIGSHKANRFRILLRDCQGAQSDFDQRLSALQKSGVPNYFGVQRFGRDMRNLDQVLALFQQQPQAGAARGRHRRGMQFSAARAYLFNQVLSRRLAAGNWCQYQAGDVLSLDGTSRFFTPGEGGWDAQLQQRLDSFDIHLTGPLPGLVSDKDKYISTDITADIENAVLENYPELLDGLRSHGLQASRRALRFRAYDLQWQWLQRDQLALEFSLARGAYATSLLREVCQTEGQDSA